eukprot:CAMPEP_0184685448 /NCGR_PEP_ID=MMETSP0312-20130426/19037_1 /TAXON_ID=31354 /ORGANISM="Compsopogon coeruleus, Strain SAG 36.94" /LENGTH=203 /DNA_ID=CAMNT_0027139569 /DNA_START=27 /DNA_END=638 /DNA_ORIENTATION=+
MVAMQYANRLDQTDPVVVWWVRVTFTAYVAIASVLYIYMADQVARKYDQRELRVPLPVNPFAGSNQNSDAHASHKTVQQYDAEMINQNRRGLMMNSLIIAFIHAKMGVVSPLVTSAVMGLTRFLDDPQVKLHILGLPDVGPLKRPFTAENPLAKLLGMESNQESEASSGQAGTEGQSPPTLEPPSTEARQSPTRPQQGRSSAS